MSADGTRSEPPGPTSMGAVRLKQARTYLLANPTHSKSQAVLATGLSDATIARARRDLIAEGLLPEPRNAPPRPVQHRAKLPEPKQAPAAAPARVAEPGQEAEPAPAKSKQSAGMMDHAALMQLADMIDKAVDSGDDATIQKILLKQCLTFAMRTDLHPDTRMSASQMWNKLRELSKAKDLGPGKPKTREEAVRRIADQLIAVGPEITVEAVHLAFDVGGTDGQTANDQAAPTGGTPQAPSAAGHASAPAPAEVVRPEQVAVRRHGDTDESVGHPNLPGPEAGREGATGDSRTPAHPHGDSPWN